LPTLKTFVIFIKEENKMANTLVSIMMGSDSDLDKMKKAAKVFEEFEVGFEIQILSAHRAPKEMIAYVEEAEKRGIKIFIAGAGLAAHLPGMVAACTTLPVIGVPISAGSLDGLDALLSIVQMPKGVPVATVGLDNATNAALTSLRILGTADETIAAKLKDYKAKQTETVLAKNKAFQERN
jgi:phosphoribosylaminoimidazole carboxylase PurE protein